MKREAQPQPPTTTEAEPVPQAPPTPEPVPAPQGEREPDFLWAGRPVFECHRGCGERYQRIENLEAVLEHERDRHPTVERESPILDAGGLPVIVREN
jgi:hypothetical protein